MCGISRGFLRGFQPVWDGFDQVLSGPWCPHPPRQDHEDSSEILKFRHPSLERLTTNFAAVIRDNAVDRERR